MLHDCSPIHVTLHLPPMHIISQRLSTVLFATSCDCHLKTPLPAIDPALSTNGNDVVRLQITERG